VGRRQRRSHAGTTLLYGIVPDGVSSIALLFPENNNTEITTQVTENFFLIAIPPPLQHGVAAVIWRDARGRTLKSFPQLPLSFPQFPQIPLP
jgi:hypothetical protein